MNYSYRPRPPRPKPMREGGEHEVTIEAVIMAVDAAEITRRKYMKNINVRS